jgi:hypothetical protein
LSYGENYVPAVNFRGDQIPNIVEAVIDKFVISVGVEIEPLASRVRDRFTALLAVEPVVPEEVGKQLIDNVLLACQREHLRLQKCKAEHGADATVCRSCDRPTWEDEGYEDWCEYCYHEIRPLLRPTS